MESLELKCRITNIKTHSLEGLNSIFELEEERICELEYTSIMIMQTKKQSEE